MEWFVESVNEFLQGDQGTLAISVLVFLAVASLFSVFALILLPVIRTRRALARELAASNIDRRSPSARLEMNRISSRGPVEQYFAATQDETRQPNSIRLRLFQAGFYGRDAVLFYNFIRIGSVVVGFLLTYLGLNHLVGPNSEIGMPATVPLLGGLVIGAGFMTAPSIALDFLANGVKEKFRRSFPDFMDMMITCADAGMSLEAAIERVSSEFASTHKHLGVQLSILTLQLRAGKPLRDALHELAHRIGLDEARALAVLFRQSEELGTSLVEALRVYSAEMRIQRVLRAEEKANALPVKMVIPLGICVFPVVLMIVMLPVVVRLKGVFF